MPLTKLQGQLIDSTTNLTANNITVSGTFVPPTGNTASRPSNPVVGTTWFNSTLNTLESWSGSIWQSAGGGLILQTVQNTSFTAAVGSSYPVNTSNGAITVTLPASPTAGQQINIFDYGGTASSNNITINANGNKIYGDTQNATIGTQKTSATLIYVDGVRGWVELSSAVGNIQSTYSVSYLVAAGGGGGSNNTAPGGGAGGLLLGYTVLTTSLVYSITIGAGGTAGVVGAGNGGNSTFLGYTAIGGGRGWAPGGSGGSGGGGHPGYAGGSGTSGQGNAGGAGVTGGQYGCGGGGGAGAVGSDGTTNGGGNGGIGLSSSITGSSVYYCGGGGGGANGGPAASGGLGGGGAGTGVTNASGTAGTANTGGGGGGGAGTNNSTGYGGAGGSGVVILSIPTSSYSGTTTGLPTVTISGANTILKFTSSGSYTA